MTMKTMRKKKYSKKVEKINNQIITAENAKDVKKIFEILVNKEKLLRSIQEAAGKGSRLRPQDDDLM